MKNSIIKPIMSKEGKTIRFDKIVLDKLEERAKKQGTKVSNIVNFIIRQKIFSDVEFYRELAKYHYLKFQEYNIIKEQQEVMVQTKEGY